MRDHKLFESTKHIKRKSDKIEIAKLYSTGRYNYRELSGMFDISISTISSFFNKDLVDIRPDLYNEVFIIIETKKRRSK